MVELYFTGNGFSIIVLDKNENYDYGFTVEGSAVYHTHTIKALRRMRIKTVRCASRVSGEYRADLADAGFTVESI